ncbi:hypothetical protein [Desulfuromonas sp. TF]|uniref:hypothetical protein n=1 Tax=Desulfuromonas sp. TF TaxID=1232410 RepID=UPI0012DF66B1|nr:hypothetical protein [Desulfuromonas sp. TF]
MNERVVAMPDVKRQIEAEITQLHPEATNFQFSIALREFLGGRVYYIEYEDDQNEEENNQYYAHVDANGEIDLYDDGVDVLRELQLEMDKRRTFLQRINEISFSEFIGGIIAILVTIAFLTMWAFRDVKSEYIPIFSIVLGYYFGKNVGK